MRPKVVTNLKNTLYYPRNSTIIWRRLENGTDQPVQTKWSKCPIKIPGVNFGNSIHNNSTWDKITEGLTKKNSISGTEWHLLFICKKIIVNQTLLSKLWYIGQIYTIPKYTKTKLKECTISSWTEKKMRPSRHLAYNSISLEGWTGNYRHRYSIKLSKNKTDLKVIKSYQYSPERSHAPCIDLT